MLSYILVAIVVAVTTGLLLYLDSRLFDKPKKRITYIKVICMNILIVLSTMYVLTWLSPTSNLKDIVQAGGKPKIEGPIINIKEIGEEMFSDKPPF